MFSRDDLIELQRQGVTPEAAEHQLELIRRGFPRIVLERPCTAGDGLLQLDADGRQACLLAFDRARDEGRISKFVPASGAATRMFQALLSAHGSGLELTIERLEAIAESETADEAVDPDEARLVSRFFRAIEEFPFTTALRDVLLPGAATDGARTLTQLVAQGRGRWILETVLREPGLGFASLPKGLIPFHLYSDGPRTPFAEHVAESHELLGEGGAPIRLHFTVPPGFEERIRTHLVEATQEFPDTTFVIDLSIQSPSTDTLAADPSGEPFRSTDGRLVFRPGGHGALLTNLGELGGDLVLVKNIDNIARRSYRRRQHHFRKVLAGLVVRLEEQVAEWRSSLASIEQALDSAGRDAVIGDAGGSAGSGEASRSERAGSAPDEFAARLAEIETAYASTFCRTVPSGETGPRNRIQTLRDLLDRPIRVCGMVRNEGEPGGGPFWVRHPDGSLDIQIVELSQVDRNDPSQREAVEKATHFNPVDLTVSLRNAEGEPYELSRFVDEETGIVANKSDGGRPLSALELPGLWNGSMAAWNTVFLEIPIETFTPVKTILDLQRDPHRGADA
ncbi:MAG: DUF4301 family protein [Candidatus Eisenbacteria bacterium]